MSLFAPRSLFRPLVLASAGAILLVGSAALADDHRGPGRGPDGYRGPDRGRDYGQDRRWDHNRGTQWRNDRDRVRTNVIVNWNSRPYWNRPGFQYHRPVVVYRDPYPNYYMNYTTFYPIMQSPEAYNVFEYTQPNVPVVVNNNNLNYTLTPGQVTDGGNGRYCREYQAKVMVNNRLQDSYGQACRQPDGSWEIVS